ncbi:twin-arginine translocase TatA/TatE family subunit [Gordonia iterans]|uniref:Sec-independent protein translocase protein TatA n=1 Tax=Gordonia iterans TaxID=1004901 RepID=A0A2S0KGH9_9ACTN|nr:Sec-independent protein translocase subunit TatA [Gordonia iterans]AVM00782.1 twin-arginine translocase TatA/TatE family subunit [Gordonia iterans]
MGAMQPWHWIVVIVVVVILFGSKKLPDAARGLGRSMRILKSEMGEMTGDGKKDEAEQPRELPPSDPAPGAGPGAEARRAADKHADS